MMVTKGEYLNGLLLVALTALIVPHGGKEIKPILMVTSDFNSIKIVW